MDDILIGLVLDIGEQMLQTGGEVSRVEDTIERILRAYGFVRVDVFTITSEIQVTAVHANGHVVNQLRRIHRWGTNLEKLEELNQLSRDICRRTPDVEELRELLWSGEGIGGESGSEGQNRLQNSGRVGRYGKLKNGAAQRRESRVAVVREGKKRDQMIGQMLTAYLGGIFASSSFTIFFGGSLKDACVTAILACIITAMGRRSSYRSENQLLYYFFFSVITGIVGNLIVAACGSMGIALNLDKILIGCVMLTIPGIAITYSVRDMLLGETITGMMRFVESLLIAASIASGYILSSFFVGGIAR